MSMRCEEVRPLLAELAYEEVAPGVAEALREHLGSCLSCRRHQMAFAAVRRDLQEWQPAEPGSHGIRFITPENGRTAATPIWHSRWFQGLAAAAAFAFIAVLTAAAVNLQVHSGPDGWVMTTSFGQRQPLETAPPVVALQQIPELNSWFDARFDAQLDNQLGKRLADRGVVTLASMPEQQFFTDGQLQELNRRVAGVLDNTLTERDLELGARFDDLEYRFNSSLDMQANNFIYTLTSLVDGMEAEHNDQLFQVTQFYENRLTDTERRVAEANWRIDSLSAAALSRSPEQ
jgi:hypothetical protein